jgi:fatty acid desaturase
MIPATDPAHPLTVPVARPARLVRYAVEEWLKIAAAWGSLVLVDGMLWSAVVVIVVAGRFHALGVILHDACHLPRRALGQTGRLLEALAGWPIGSTIAAMRYHHLRHHRRPASLDDPYCKPGIEAHPRAAWIYVLPGLLLPLLWSLRPFAAQVALALPALRLRFARVFLQERATPGQGELLECLRADRAQLVGQLPLWACAALWPVAFATFYLLPWSLAGLVNAWRVNREHRHALLAAPDRDCVWAATRDLVLPILGPLILAPRNIGYHRVHHRYPRCALEHLPALHARHAASMVERRRASQRPLAHQPSAASAAPATRSIA